MRVVEVPRYGGADVLTLAEREMPVPGPGQVLVRVRAAGVNPFDYKMREGWLSAFYPMQLPYIPGSDFAGEVVAQGAGVTDLVPGDRVYGSWRLLMVVPTVNTSRSTQAWCAGCPAVCRLLKPRLCRWLQLPPGSLWISLG